MTKIIITPLQAFILLVALVGCSSGQKQTIFRLKDNKETISKNATIAVIAASSSLPVRELVNKISAELSEQNTLQVMRQNDIDKVYKKQNEYFENATSEEEVLKETGNFHKMMDTRYVYFVISNGASIETIRNIGYGGRFAGSSEYVSIPVDAYLVEYPRGEIIAETHYTPRKKVGLFSNSDDTAVKVIDMAAEKIVKQIMKNIE